MEELQGKVLSYSQSMAQSIQNQAQLETVLKENELLKQQISEIQKF